MPIQNIQLVLDIIVMSFLILLFVLHLTNKLKQKIFQQSIVDHLQSITKQITSTEQHLRENLLINLNHSQNSMAEKLNQSQVGQIKQLTEVKEQMQQAFALYRTRFDERQLEILKILQDTLHKGTLDNRQQIKEALLDHARELGKRVDQLTQTTEIKLKEINNQVEKRLTDGFEKTNATFSDVIKRLALIDAAQKQISELSDHVVSLHDILNDKRSRGAFGEVQLSALIYNMIPEQHFSFQHLLSNNKRPDCMLFLPQPTGNIAIDAKFPLENFRVMIDNQLSEIERQQASKQFKIDLRKHIQDIAAKYIIPGETADGAVMFIPAEAIFAEIHAHHADIVEIAQKSNVWMVSPTTMMAILTTARAVLKDAATREQVHAIQTHLRALSEDFERFQIRMDNLAKRIAQTHSDVEQVHISSRKITQRFIQIERAELDPVQLTPNVALPQTPPDVINETSGVN